MTLKQKIEEEMAKLGLRKNLGEGWDLVTMAIKRREQVLREEEEDE